MGGVDWNRNAYAGSAQKSVAPRMGGVDWNFFDDEDAPDGKVAPRMGAWIETILGMILQNLSGRPPCGGVDCINMLC